MNKPEDYNKESLEGSFLNGFLSEDIWEASEFSLFIHVKWLFASSWSFSVYTCGTYTEEEDGCLGA